MNGWAAAGQAAGQMAGTFIQNAGNARQNRKNRALQRELMGIQFKNQQRLNQQGHDLQFDMWNKTNAAAQVKHYEDAGLNVGMMYGGSGSGGTTGSQGGGSAAGGSAPSNIPMQAMDIGNALATAAQIKLMEAQAKKTDAEAAKISGVDTTKAETEIQSLTQGIENAKAQETLTKAQEYLTRIEGYVQGESKEDRIDSIMYNAEKAMYEVQSVKANAEVDSKTIDDKINIVREAAIGASIENALKRTNITKTKEEIKAISQGVIQKWEALKQSGQGVNIQQFKAEVEAEFPTIGEAMGRMANSWVDLLKMAAGRDVNERDRKVD